MELISVLMPIYNDEKYIDRAIQSILNQTYTNFELLLLLEYGSNEESKRIVYSYKDRRIRVIENKSRLGISESLNVGIREAKGEYLARIDSDDICFKNRFEKQITYMKQNGLDVLGTAAYINGNKLKKLRRPISQQEIIITALFYNPFIHPSMMIRKNVLVEKNIFYKKMKSSEDYELWTRLILKAHVGNMEEALLNYTIRQDNKTHCDSNYINTDVHTLQLEYASQLGLKKDFERDFDTVCLNSEEFIKREKFLVDVYRKLKNNPMCSKVVVKEAAKLYVHNGRFGLNVFTKLMKPVSKGYILLNQSMQYVFYACIELVKGRMLER